jgi:scyllo-inositol 2-dehydrogenase (NADP+)
MSKNTIRVGIVGFGFAAQTFHVPLISALPEEFEIIAVSSSKPEVVHSVLPQAQVFSSPQDLLAHPQVDAVVITAPNTLHYPLSREALAAGKHLVVEKPVTITSAEAEDLAAAAHQANKIASVFQSRRWDSDFLTLKKTPCRSAPGGTESTRNPLRSVPHRGS